MSFAGCSSCAAAHHGGVYRNGYVSHAHGYDGSSYGAPRHAYGTLADYHHDDGAYHHHEHHHHNQYPLYASDYYLGNIGHPYGYATNAYGYAWYATPDYRPYHHEYHHHANCGCNGGSYHHSW